MGTAPPDGPAQPGPAPLAQARIGDSARGPFALDYQDSYHGPAGPLRQAEAVFLAQSGLPHAWQQRAVFTVLETGFGLGFNFLATWLAWQRDPDRCDRLHFISIERHPVALADLARAHAREPALAALARQLRQQMPLPLAGSHRLSFADGRVTLTLVYGDGASALEELACEADAIFMDGFAPDRNPQLWSPQVCSLLARLARPGARLASWCTAGQVRRALAEQGFAVTRHPGIAGKFQMLQAVRTGAPSAAVAGAPAAAAAAAPAHRTAAIIGAGLAGTTLARALLQRGWSVALIDAAAGPGRAASGNPSGVVRPLWSRDDNPVTRLTRAAFLHTIRTWGAGQQAGADAPGAPRSGWHPTGVLQLAHDAEQADTWIASLQDHPWPGDFVHWLDPAQVARRCGVTHSPGGLMFALGGWAEPAHLCSTALPPDTRWPGQLHCHWLRHVHGIVPAADGRQWQVLTDDRACLAEVDHVVFCSGAGDAPALAAGGGLAQAASGASWPDAARSAERSFLPADARALQALRGEITQVAGTGHPGIDLVLCAEGYLSPMPDGSFSIGATYDREGPAGTTAAGTASNLARAARLGGVDLALAAVLDGRVGWRSVAADRLPIAGADAHLPGVWHLRALASRGVVWSTLMAEQVACSMHGEPAPLLRSEAARISPARPVLRQRPPR